MAKQIPHLFVLLLMLNLSMYSFTGNCPNKRISILILTDSVIIHIRHIFTILDIKSKYYKWNVVKRSIRKDREEKRGRKKPDSFFFKWKKKMKKFHLNTNTMIQISKKFSYTFSSDFLSFDSCVFTLFCLFVVFQTEQYLVSHLLVYAEADIERCSVKQLFGKIQPKSLQFFKQLWVNFHYSLLNKKVYKRIKMKHSTSIF